MNNSHNLVAHDRQLLRIMRMQFELWCAFTTVSDVYTSTRFVSVLHCLEAWGPAARRVWCEV